MSRKSNRRRHRRRQEHQRSTSKTMERSSERAASSSASSGSCSCAGCWLESESRADLLAVAPSLESAAHIVAFVSVLASFDDHLRVLFVLDPDGRIIDLARCADHATPSEIGDVAWSCFGLLPPESLLVVASVEWDRLPGELGITSDEQLEEVADLFQQTMVVDSNGVQTHLTSVTARHDPWDVAGVGADAVFDGFAGLFGGEAQGAAGRSGSVDHPDQEPT